MEGFIDIIHHLNFLLFGMRWTIQVSLLAIAGGGVVGLVVALIRLANLYPLSWIAVLYIDFFRSTPLLAQLLWIYYALPILVGRSLPSVESAVLGLSLYSGAFLAEIIRAGILSVERGQTEAGLALGMTRSQALRRIVLPQAVVRMLPPVGSTFITLVKDSALASLVGLPELMRQAEALASYTLRRTETFTVAAFLYFGLTYLLSIVVNDLHRRLGVESAERPPAKVARWRWKGKKDRAVSMEI